VWNDFGVTAHDSARAEPSNGLGLRLLVVAAVVVAQIVCGMWFHLSANAYVLLTFPVLIVFQLAIARRPLREVWVRSAPGWRRGRKAKIAAVTVAAILAIAPTWITVASWMDGDVTGVAYGAVAIVGAVAAAYTFTSIRRAPGDSGGPSVRTTLSVGAKAAAITVPIIAVIGLLALVSGGGARSDASVLDFLGTAGASFAIYVPVVFVVEEVLFRGAFDSYVHRDPAAKGPMSAVLISALWGAWHLPVASSGSGLAALVPLVVFQVALGYPLTMAWRRGGSLAAPGVVHALLDAVRNGIAALG